MYTWKGYTSIKTIKS